MCTLHKLNNFGNFIKEFSIYAANKMSVNGLGETGGFTIGVSW
jgi:hypothetical protein